MALDANDVRPCLAIVCNVTSSALVGAIAILASCLAISFAPSAQALPSFARQTGQPCGTCHTDFPALTPFGRRFKLLGYTDGRRRIPDHAVLVQGRQSTRAPSYDKLRGYAQGAIAPPPPPSQTRGGCRRSR